MHNLSGKLSGEINNIRSSLIELLAQIEASIDFPDEVSELPYDSLNIQLSNLLKSINTILNKATDGNILSQGIKVIITGKPNVGKSSLFNYLLKRDRAIVTNIPGTTRDILQEYIDLDGIPVILTDTAGIRNKNNTNSADYIESIGIDRSLNAVTDGDIILFIYDITQGIKEEDLNILEEINNYNKPVLKIANKTDLVENHYDTTNDTVHISSITGEGINCLKQEIKQIILGDSFNISNDELYINLRHKECLNKAKKHIKFAIDACNKGEAQDLISIDIKASLISLDEIVGEAVSEEIIDHIFSQFCIGK